MRQEDRLPGPGQAGRIRPARNALPYLLGALSVVLVALLAAGLQTLVPLSSVSIVFLVAVLVSAVRWGLGASVFAAVLSVFVYDFFFVHPVHTFLVASPQDVLALVIFLAVGILTSNLTARMRWQAEERARLAQEMAEARVLAESERLRSALLSSISHDLRTPLASITGAVTSMLRFRASYDEATQTELLQTIDEEAERLDRFVSNLLQMTRLGAGALELNRDWVDLEDLIGAALARLAHPLAAYHVCIETQKPLPMLELDFVLMEQVLVNLLDNAVKYSPPGTTIRICGCKTNGWAVLEIGDEGIGVPPADMERIFHSFHRTERTDRQSAGTGLGLSICRGIVEAHGGEIFARLPETGPGTVFVLKLPMTEMPVMEVEQA